MVTIKSFWNYQFKNLFLWYIFASDLYEKTTFFAGNSAAFHLKSSVFQQFSNINKFVEV